MVATASLYFCDSIGQCTGDMGTPKARMYKLEKLMKNVNITDMATSRAIRVSTILFLNSLAFTFCMNPVK